MMFGLSLYEEINPFFNFFFVHVNAQNISSDIATESAPSFWY